VTADLAAIRRRYAELMTSPVPGADPRIRAALSTVPREDFLGPPPWTVRGASMPLTTRDPADLYHDVLVTLDASRRVNNGSPSLHAQMLHRLGVQLGQRVLHLGTGGGYYTALLAELAGPAGQVRAVEFDAHLAEAARDNLRPWPQVTVLHGDGAAYPGAAVDRIYVSFGLARPADGWLDHLVVGGVLIFPLVVPDAQARPPLSGRGTMLVVTRTPAGFAASAEMPVGFVFAEGPTAGDEALRAALRLAFGRGDEDQVRSLHRHRLPAERSWLSTDRFSLGLDPP
jgi:protein-L-isoaspartate(D-aspartate) O-methyltransferase